MVYFIKIYHMRNTYEPSWIDVAENSSKLSCKTWISLLSPCTGSIVRITSGNDLTLQLGNKNINI